MLYELFLFLVDIIKKFGYFGIFLTTMIENSFLPIASEITLIPAGYAASKGDMNIIIIFILSVIGSTIGALINYYIAYIYGEDILLKYGKYFFLDKAKLDQIKRFFLKYGGISIFVGRFLPGLKHFITFPAGIVKMSITRFIVYSMLSSMIWCSVILYIGYSIGENEDLIRDYMHKFNMVILVIVVLLLTYYIFQAWKRKYGYNSDNIIDKTKELK